MKIRLFGDLHYSHNWRSTDNFEDYREEFYNNFIDFLFEQESDFYISLGDLTNTGLVSEYEGIYNKIDGHIESERFHIVLGNHDLKTIEKNEIAKIIKSPFYYSLIRDNYLFLFLDSTVFKQIGGELGDDQLNWVKEQLTYNTDKNVFILVHHPIYKTTYLSNVENAFIKESENLLNLLLEHPKKVFFINGHKHADSIVVKDNITFIQISAILDQPVVREIEINEETLSMTFLKLDEHSEQLAHWLASKMEHYRLVPYGYRGEENRTLNIKL